MNPVYRLACHLVFTVIVTLAAVAASTNGATFSTDLTLAPAASPRGEYLTASYNFGVAFRDVHSVTLALNMPDGYQGTAMTTGNSSLFRSLSMQIHDPADQPPVEYFSQYLGTSALDVPSGSMDFIMGRLLVNAGGSTTLADWPGFLLSGSGYVSFIDVTTSYYHALPDGVGSTGTTTWSPPVGIAGARLIIEATPVPEPSTATFAALAAVAMYSATRRKSDSLWTGK